MMMYKSILFTCLKEKFGRWYVAYYVVLGFLTLFIDKTLAYAMLFSVAIFTAIQIARMFSFQNINCINVGYVNFRMHKPIYLLNTAFLSNLPWLIVMEIKVLMSNDNIVFGIMLIWAYAVIVGMLLGIFVKSEVVGYALVLGCFFICMQKLLIHELYFRYSSPVIIFKGEFTIFNIVGICILMIAGIVAVFLTKKKTLIMTGTFIVLCFIGLTICEVLYEEHSSNQELLMIKEDNYIVEYNPILNKERVNHIAETIYKTENCLKQYGFLFDTADYQMDYTIYFPWESNQQKVFLTNKDEVCKINFYTESMCRIPDDELIARYIYSRLRQRNQLQEVAVQILIDDVSSQVLYDKRTTMLDRFSYDNLTETYGYCASPKQCVVVECIKEDMLSFATLYAAFEEVQSLNEIEVEKLNVSDEYIEIYRRILK